MRRVLLLIVVFLAGIGAACQGAPGLDPAFTRQTVETVAGTVEREYFDPSAGRRFAAMITAGLEAGRYASHATVDALAAALTRDLFDASGDKHLAVLVVRPPASGPVVADRETERATQGRRTNFGVQRIEILPGNIGYLNLTAFYRPEEAGVAFGAASGLLAGADVLILDLRQNSGGSPEMVALVASSMFDEAELPLFDIVPRPGGEVRRYATHSPALAGRNGTRPVYVLTAGQTYSAGEGLAFILQERHRAVIVGERTAGAANPGRPYPINDRLEVVVPNGRVRGAVTGRNWEGAGVTPDVVATAADALRTARILALRGLLSRAPAGSWNETLRLALADLENRRDP